MNGLLIALIAACEAGTPADSAQPVGWLAPTWADTIPHPDTELGSHAPIPQEGAGRRFTGPRR